jgi:YD repeat-containing protein
MKKYIVLFTMFFALVFSGCGGGSSSSNVVKPVDTNTTVKAIDGYIKNAKITDSSGQIALYKSNGQYIFTKPIKYPLHLSGGKIVDTNLSFDINMSTTSGTVISPITTFLENNSTLVKKLADALGIENNISNFETDYIAHSNSKMAKMAQILYLLLRNKKLADKFKKSLITQNAKNLNTLFVMAKNDINATVGNKATNYIGFVNKIEKLNVGVDKYENELYTYKKNLDNIILPPDITKPVITLNGDNPITLTQGTTYTEAGATALDDRDGTLPVTISGSVDINTLGSYTITYTATDNAGNKAESSRIVNIILASNNKTTVSKKLTYDQYGRVIREDLDSNSYIEYSYDNSGNLVSQTVVK